MWKQRSRDETRFSASCEFATGPTLPLSASDKVLIRENINFYAQDNSRDYALTLLKLPHQTPWRFNHIFSPPVRAPYSTLDLHANGSKCLYKAAVSRLQIFGWEFCQGERVSKRSRNFGTPRVSALVVPSPGNILEELFLWRDCTRCALLVDFPLETWQFIHSPTANPWFIPAAARCPPILAVDILHFPHHACGLFT